MGVVLLLILGAMLGVVIIPLYLKHAIVFTLKIESMVRRPSKVLTRKLLEQSAERTTKFIFSARENANVFLVDQTPNIPKAGYLSEALSQALFSNKPVKKSRP